MQHLLSKDFLIYCLKFVFIYCVCYFGSQLIIGLTVPDNYYSSFVDHYLNYISLLRKSLLETSKYVISIFGYSSSVQNNYYLKIVNGSRVKMVYSCLGIAVFSFWIAFVVANTGSVLKKLYWVLKGCILIWLINVCRISLLIISANDKWHSPINISHHTLFNIAAYAAIFIMIYFYDKSQENKTQHS